MVQDLMSGRIYKGSNAEITIPVYPPCYTGVTGISVDLYTVSGGTSIHKSVSGGTIVLSGNMGTILLQPVELEVFEDGVLRYNDRYTYSGVSYVEDLNTRYYVKTPIPYTPVDYATKQYVDDAIEEAQISGVTYSAGTNINISNRVISVTGMTEAITSATQDMATKTWVEGKGYLTQHQSLAGKQDLLVSGTNIKTINNQSILGPGNIEIQGGSGTTYTAGQNIDITNRVISVTGITVPTKTSQLQNDSGFLTQHQSLAGYATQSWVEGKGYLTQHQDISMKADISSVTQAIESATVDMATKTWVGNQGYLTQHQSLAGYATEQWVENKGYKTSVTSTDVTTALGYTPCQTVALTQAQYDALAVKDNNTIYGIIS